VVCPDKFRGSLTAADAAAAMARGLATAGYRDVRSRPLADGGEGTLDAVRSALGGAVRSARVAGPLGEPVRAEWLLVADGTAVVEMARASGLGLVPAAQRDPLGATTLGTGELIAAAARGGARRIVVGVGGSATTDGGLGALEALGWSLGGVAVTVACDVATPFLDAATVYGPQKGATDAHVELLRRRLVRLAEQYEHRTGVDVRALPGAGAAGGLAGGLAAIGAELEPGFEVVAGVVGLADALEDAQLVVTGEGRFDATSFAGKVVGGVLDWAADAGVPHRAVIAGEATDDAREELSVRGPAQLLTLTERACNTDDAHARAAVLVEEAAVAVGGAAGSV